MKTKWIEGHGSMVSCDDLHLVLYNRVEFLKKEIDYLLSCNPASDTLEASPTANRYANGMIRAYEKEIAFYSNTMNLTTHSHDRTTMS